MDGQPDSSIDMTQSLFLALKNDHPKCVEFLIKAGADVSENCYGMPPLLFTTEVGHNDIAKLLVQAGAAVNTGVTLDEIPLMLAASNGYTDCVQTLIEAGADVNKKDNYGYTAISCAVRNGYSECAEVLIKAGADVNILDFDGQPPIASTTDYQCIDLLLKAGADINNRDKFDSSSLIINVTQRVRYDCLKILVRAGADVNSSRDKLASPLHSLMLYPNRVNSETGIRCIKFLLRSGVKVNVFRNNSAKGKDSYYVNALGKYIFKCSVFGDEPNEEVCLLLYAAGETIDGTTVAGTVASSCVHVPIPEYLLRNLCLKNICRNAIKNHMIKLDPPKSTV